MSSARHARIVSPAAYAKAVDRLWANNVARLLLRSGGGLLLLWGFGLGSGLLLGRSSLQQDPSQSLNHAFPATQAYRQSQHPASHPNIKVIRKITLQVDGQVACQARKCLHSQFQQQARDRKHSDIHILARLMRSLTLITGQNQCMSQYVYVPLERCCRCCEQGMQSDKCGGQWTVTFFAAGFFALGAAVFLGAAAFFAAGFFGVFGFVVCATTHKSNPGRCNILTLTQPRLQQFPR